MVSLDAIWNSYPNRDWEWVGIAIGIVAIVVSVWSAVMYLLYSFCAPSMTSKERVTSNTTEENLAINRTKNSRGAMAYAVLSVQALLHVYVLALAYVDVGVHVHMYWAIGVFFVYGWLIFLANFDLTYLISTSNYASPKSTVTDREMFMGIGAVVMWLVGSIISVASDDNLDRVAFGFFYLATGLVISMIFYRGSTSTSSYFSWVTVVRLLMLFVAAFTGQLFFFYFSITELVVIVLQMIAHMNY
jgi:hypothetical protein